MGIVTDRFNNPVAVEYTFSTMNNVHDPADLDLSKGECALLQNVDVSRYGSVSRRTGYQATSIVTETHSGWSNGNIALCVNSGNLCLFNGSSLRTLLEIGNNTCRFTQVNEIIVFTNNLVSGYVQDGSASLLDGLPIGQCIEFYNGRIYIASGETLYCTSPFSLDSDFDYSVASVYDSRITFVRRVDSGLFLGTERETFFLQGSGPQSGFTQKEVAGYGAVYGTDVFVDAEDVKDGGSGAAAIWCSHQGVCYGSSTGFKNITKNYYTYEYGSQGTSMIRYEDGDIHYVAVLDKGKNAFNQHVPVVIDTDTAEY